MSWFTRYWSGWVSALAVTPLTAFTPAFATVTPVVRVLLPSLLSGMRLTSSTHARTACCPGVTSHVLAPVGPALAFTTIDSPGAIAEVVSSDHDTTRPSTEKATPSMAPYAFSTVPTFLIVAWNVTCDPSTNEPAAALTPVTTRSGRAVAADAVPVHTARARAAAVVPPSVRAVRRVQRLSIVSM
nr:hypothetical protein [Kineococcus indalonis]